MCSSSVQRSTLRVHVEYVRNVQYIAKSTCQKLMVRSRAKASIGWTVCCCSTTIT